MRLKVWLTILCVFVLATLMSLVLGDIQREWNQRVGETERYVAGLTHTLEEHALQTFHTADVLLRNIVANAQGEFASGGAALSQIPAVLVRNVELISFVEGALLLDAEGVVRADTRANSAIGDSFAGCLCFTVPQTAETADLHFDVLNGPGTVMPKLALSRRLVAPDGQFVGVAVALLDAAYMTSFYDSVRIGEGGIISLVHADGLMLVQAPRGSFAPGQSVAEHPVFREIRAGGRAGTIQTRDPLVDFDILLGWRTLEALPLVLLVSADMPELLAGWAERRQVRLVSLLAVSIAVLALVGYLWNQIGRHQRTHRELVVQKSYFQQLFDGSPEGVVILDNADCIVDANRSFQEMFQYSVDELRGRRLNDLILPDELHEEGSALSQQVLDERAIHKETVRIRKDGSVVHVSILGVPVKLHDNQVSVYGIYRDISDRMEAEQILKESEERYRVVAEQTGQIIYDYDVLSGRIAWMGAIRRITGYESAEFQQTDIDGWEAMIHPEDRDQALRLLHEAQDHEGHYHAEYRLQRKSGGWVFIEDNGAFLVNEDGAIYRMLGSLSDITERKRISSEMAWQASHDALTGLFNRHEFEERVARLLFNRRGNRRHALLYIDLDQFKVVNDTCGHQAGDQLLRQLTSQVGATVRESDTLARLGGDEFGLLLVDCPLDQSLAIAEKIIITINDSRFLWDDKTFQIGASIGLVEITPKTDSVAVLFSAADSACYAAKDKGRNQVVVYNESDHELAARHGEMAWVSRITKALEENRFLLYWQPIINIAAKDDGRKHFEVLLRLRDEDGLLIGPEAFIPAAERYNLMPQLDRWVVREAFRQVAAHKGTELSVAINLSGTTLSSEHFISYVQEQLRKTGASPQSICYEITETAAIAHIERARQFIQEMHLMGCKISLDDFGSGLSSFAYLKALMVDFIKIDGTFVKDICEDEADKAMVEAIIKVGQVMRIHTIAEFVESKAVLDELRSLGVDYAQGYYIGMPEPKLPEG